MSDKYLRTIAGGMGSLRIDHTTLINTVERPNGFTTVTVIEAAVIAILTEDGIVDSLAEHGIAGKTLGIGEVVFASTKFATIQLTSGVVSIA